MIRRDTNNFDVARLLFALLIVHNHLLELPGRGVWESIVQPFGVGLDGLFVISGFLVYNSWRNENRFVPFITRRMFRIYPAYIAVVVVQCAILIALSSSFDVADIARYLAANAAYLNFLQPTFGTTLDGLPVQAINGSLWAVKVLAGFYLLVPLLAVLATGRRIWILLAVFASSFAYFMIVKDISTRWAFQLPGRLYVFGLGMLFCLIAERMRPVHYYIIFATALAAHFSPLPEIVQQLGRDIAIAAGAMVIAFATPRIRIPRDLSLGIFLVHFPVIQISLVLGIAQHMNFPGMLAYTTLLSLLLAYGLSVAVERRGIDLGNRLARRLREHDGKQA